MKWYKTSGYDTKITEVEVIRETPQRLEIQYKHWSDPRKLMTRIVAKESSYDTYYPTFVDAKRELTKKFIMRLEAAEQQVVHCNKQLTIIEALTINDVQHES